MIYKLIYLTLSCQIDDSYTYLDVGNDGSLTIVGTQEMDAGSYACEVINEAGSDRGVVTLQVGCKYQYLLIWGVLIVEHGLFASMVFTLYHLFRNNKMYDTK